MVLALDRLRRVLGPLVKVVMAKVVELGLLKRGRELFGTERLHPAEGRVQAGYRRVGLDANDAHTLERCVSLL